MSTTISTPAQPVAEPGAAVWYTVEKNRFYREGEVYSSGSGFEGSTLDRAQAELWFETFSRPHGDEVFSLELRMGQTILKRSGPAKAAANRTMMAAYRARYPAKPETARHCATCTFTA